jgi:GAF domain-containing protein
MNVKGIQMAIPNKQVNKTLLNKERLRVLRDLALIDSPEETIYDRLTQLASKAIGAPVSLVSMVAADYQFFKSQVGLPAPWSEDRRTPLSHSFCKHVVASNEPLIVEDARTHELVKDNEAIPDLDVIGYLGMPLTMQDGKRLGSFCVIDSEPRRWKDTEIAIMRELSEILTREIDMRALANIDASYQDKLDDMHRSIENLIDTVNTDNSQEVILQQLQDARERFTI